MKSFDDALNKHKNNLSADLIGFDEGKRVRRIIMDIDSNSSDYEYYFQAGAQSRQSEVDELKKRIDDVLKFANDAHSDLNIGMLKMVKILKGAINET